MTPRTSVAANRSHTEKESGTEGDVSKAADLTGQQFGRLTAISFAGRNTRGASLWNCRCICGNECVVRLSNLQSGNTKSCGCLARNSRMTPWHLTHGESGCGGTRRPSPEYAAWQQMQQRCYNKDYPCYLNYGSRGISVCSEWRKSYPAFLKDVGRRPSPKHSLDRIDNDGNYEPGNVRWATAAEQARNHRNTILIGRLGNKSICLEDVIKVCGISGSTVRGRLKRGWTLEKAIYAPAKNRGPVVTK
jgi:hypothetical protein